MGACEARRDAIVILRLLRFRKDKLLEARSDWPPLTEPATQPTSRCTCCADQWQAVRVT